jgi:type IX secretion system PorP/SprF family membrane protein
MTWRRLLVVCGLLLGLGLGLTGQDFHYSQFENAPLRINPGLTGVFGGDTRFQGLFRKQWWSVPVDYRTFSAMVDHNFIKEADQNSFFSAGLGLNYDRAGDSNLSWADIDLNLGYTTRLTDRAFLSVGGQLGFVQRRFLMDDLRFDNQFDPGRGTFDPTLPTGETVAGAVSNVFLDLGVGINLRLQAKQSPKVVNLLDKRNRLDLGVGFFHLNQPNQSFLDEANIALPLRVSPYAFGVLQVASSVDLIGRITYQIQEEYRQLTTTGGAQFHLNRTPGQQFSLMLGVGFRHNDFQDAYFPTAEIHLNDWRFGFSYDFNTSAFDKATDHKGAIEFSARYLIRKIRKLPVKYCPLI